MKLLLNSSRTQLLQEIDGLKSKPGIYILGCTNKIKEIDLVFLMPGRNRKRDLHTVAKRDERK